MIVGLFSAGKGGQGTELLALEFSTFIFPFHGWRIGLGGGVWCVVFVCVFAGCV